MTPALPDEVVAVGGDLRPLRLLAAYAVGIFPMHLHDETNTDVLCWWSPDPRGVIIVDDVRPRRSLRRAPRDYAITCDTAFADVVRACGDPARPHGWINDAILDAYTQLHQLGHAHSIEAWFDGELVGGVYGVAVGGLFAGESMFHHRRDASKAVVLALLGALSAAGPGRLVDVQWLTPHLATLGAVEISRRDYESRLPAVCALADVDWTGLAWGDA